jgi:hypothetical protein
MVIEHGARDLIGQLAPQLRKVRPCIRCNLDHDQPRDRQVVKGKSVAKPGLQ